MHPDVLRPEPPASARESRCAPGDPVPGGTCPACGAALPPGWAAAGRAVSPPFAAPPPILAAAQRTWALSPREQVIFQLLGRGYDNRSLARALSLSERTVKRHVTAILAKLRLESRLQAGLAALLAWCPLPDQGPAGPEAGCPAPCPPPRAVAHGVLSRQEERYGF